MRAHISEWGGGYIWTVEGINYFYFLPSDWFSVFMERVVHVRC